MSEAVAYLNGQILPAHQATLSIVDAGFVMGATVTEQLRTFDGQLFRAARHLERLRHSLEVCGIKPGIDSDDFGRIAENLVARNHPLLTPGDDLGLAIFVTPGLYVPLAGARDLRSPTSGLRPPFPTVGMHTFPLSFGLWANGYSGGVALATTSIQQVPPQCWPAELKCRSRMHYFLADQEATVTDPGARALLLDAEGRVSETSTANILIHVAGTGLISPPRANVLPGVSLEVVNELAGNVGIPFVEREIWTQDVAAADEVLLSSTPNCLLPVTRFDGRAIGSGMPGPIFKRLLTAWNELVGLDVVEQARRFAGR